MAYWGIAISQRPNPLVAPFPAEQMDKGWQAIAAEMKANVAGSGSVTASLVHSKLSVSGTFEGLRGPATVAQIREGFATGVRGAPGVGFCHWACAHKQAPTNAIPIQI